MICPLGRDAREQSEGVPGSLVPQVEPRDGLRPSRRPSLPWLCVFLAATTAAQEKPPTDRIPWQLPTENRYLFEKQPKKFYQPTISRRLISGMFGFTRTSDPEPARIFERFHKGIDIKPLRRDGRGEPLDPVRACADGVVVRVNDNEKISDYGSRLS